MLRTIVFSEFVFDIIIEKVSGKTSVANVMSTITQTPHILIPTFVNAAKAWSEQTVG